MRYPSLNILTVYIAVFFLGAHQADGGIDRTAQLEQQQPSAAYQPAYTKYHDLLHTKLEVSFDWKKQYLHGIATLQLKPHFYPQQQLLLDAQHFEIHSIALLEDQLRKPLNYLYDNKQLTIELDRAYTKEEPYWLEITYTAQPNENKPQGRTILSANKGLYFINPDGSDPNKPLQIWTQGEPNTSSCWFPTIDAPNQQCTQEIYITVEDKFSTLSNGVLVYATLNEDQTRTDYWRMDLPHAPYLFMLAVGEFAEIQDEWNDIPVYYYVEPAYEPYARAIFGNTPEMLTFFSEKLDYPYPWPKYSQVVVRDYIAAAMENTTAVIFTEALQVDDRALLDKNYDDLIAHELFHHWFGNLVTCESWAHLPLNESLACLGAHLWQAHKEGYYARDRSIWNTLHSYLEEAQHQQVSLIRPHYTDPGELFDSHSYHKGALVLHILQYYLGEEAFFQSLSHYLKKHAFSTADIHQFRKAFEEITGEDLNWFFNQWFLAPGHPRLRVEHTYTNRKLNLKIWQKQHTPTPIYQLPLAVDIWIQGNKKRHIVTIDKAYNEFTWELPQQPELVYIDRNCLLAGEIEHPKTAAEYQYLYHHGEDFFAKHEALTYFINNDHKAIHYPVLQAALQDNYWFFRMMAVNALGAYKEKDHEAILLSLSQADSHVAVRAAAIRILSSLQEAHQYTDVYKANLDASSYHLASTALSAYAATSEDDAKPTILAKFEAYDNLEIITALANYYIATKQLNKYAWFKDKITRLYNHADFQSLILLFGNYLAIIPDKKKQEDGLMLIHAIADKHAKPQLRLAIYNALKQMPKTRTVKKIISQIETNK